MKKFANTTAPSSSPATFAPATVRTLKMLNGISGSFDTRLDHEERDEQRGRDGEPRDRPARAQPWCGAFDTA